MRFAFAVGTMLVLPLLAACADAPAEEASADEGALIGGKAAPAAYAAVGALADVDGNVFCTATLVARDYVITAQHCIEGGSEGEPAPHVPAEVTFRLGARAGKPTRSVRLRGFVPVPEFPELPTSSTRLYSSDVMLAQLAEPITDVAPIPIGRSPEASEIGTSFESVGFGVRSPDGFGAVGGRREVGTFVLEATSGNAFQKRFGSKEGFERHLATIDPAGAEDGIADRLYAHADLDERYQVFARSEKSETCYSDSGGPLLRVRDGKLSVVGVVSSGFPGYASSCLHLGTVFAAFGPRTLELFRGRGVAPTSP